MVNRNISELQFKHNSNESHHWVEAFHPNFKEGKSAVGEISWNKKSGVISNITVDESFQKQGIGTALYKEAHNYSPNPVHSKYHTSAGKSWVKKIGGR